MTLMRILMLLLPMILVKKSAEDFLSVIIETISGAMLWCSGISDTVCYDTVCALCVHCSQGACGPYSV